MRGGRFNSQWGSISSWSSKFVGLEWTHGLGCHSFWGSERQQVQVPLECISGPSSKCYTNKWCRALGPSVKGCRFKFQNSSAAVTQPPCHSQCHNHSGHQTWQQHLANASNEGEKKGDFFSPQSSCMKFFSCDVSMAVKVCVWCVCVCVCVCCSWWWWFGGGGGGAGEGDIFSWCCCLISFHFTGN